MKANPHDRQSPTPLPAIRGGVLLSSNESGRTATSSTWRACRRFRAAVVPGLTHDLDVFVKAAEPYHPGGKHKHVRPLRASARTVWDGPRFKANARTNGVDAPHEVAHHRPMMYAGRFTRDPTGAGGDNPMRRTEISSRVNRDCNSGGHSPTTHAR